MNWIGPWAWNIIGSPSNNSWLPPLPWLTVLFPLLSSLRKIEGYLLLVAIIFMLCPRLSGSLNLTLISLLILFRTTGEHLLWRSPGRVCLVLTATTSPSLDSEGTQCPLLSYLWGVTTDHSTCGLWRILQHGVPSSGAQDWYQCVTSPAKCILRHTHWGMWVQVLLLGLWGLGWQRIPQGFLTN